jgi:hypothetical protein
VSVVVKSKGREIRVRDARLSIARVKVGLAIIWSQQHHSCSSFGLVATDHFSKPTGRVDDEKVITETAYCIGFGKV